MTYKQAMDYIDSFLLFGSKLGLTRITKLLNDLDNPQDKLKFIHIAGTNGKGSVSCYCANIFQNAGKKVGMFISPYIIDFRERFQINGEMISEKDLIRIIKKIKAVVEANSARPVPTWIDVNRDELSVKIINLPNRDQIDAPVEEQLIVEFYSR